MEVTIRRTEPADAKELKAIYECPNAYSDTLQLPNPSIEHWEQRITKAPENVYSYVALLNDAVVGNLGFVVEKNPRRRHVATFGMGVKDSVVGQGVGSKLLTTALDLSDNWLNLKRIEITVFIDNTRAIKLYEKFGFKIEGESEAFAFRNGEYVSAYYMARVTSNA